MTPSPIEVEVEVEAERGELHKLARAAIPPGDRWRRPLACLLHALVAFAPGPILVVAFGLSTGGRIYAEIGVAAILVMVLLEWWTPWRDLAAAKITLSEEGLELEQGARLRTLPGSTLTGLHQSDEALVIVVLEREWLVVPRRSFADFERFVAALREQIGARSPDHPGKPESEAEPGTIDFGATVFFVGCAASLAWVAWDPSFWVRAVCAPLAGLFAAVAPPDTPRSPGEVEPEHEHDNEIEDEHEPRATPTCAAARLHLPRPSLTWALRFMIVAASLLYVTLVAGPIARAIFGAQGIAATAHAAHENFGLLERRRSSAPPEREVVVDPIGVHVRDAHGSATVRWRKLAQPDLAGDEIGLRWTDGEDIVSVPYAAFPSARAREDFLAIVRSRRARSG